MSSRIRLLSNANFKNYERDITQMYNDFRHDQKPVNSSVLKRMMNSESYKIWFVECGEVTSLAFLILNISNGPKEVCLDAVYVNPHCRRLGLNFGSSLIKRAIKYSKRRKYGCMELYRESKNTKLESYYKNLGFSNTTTDPDGVSTRMIQIL